MARNYLFACQSLWFISSFWKFSFHFVLLFLVFVLVISTVLMVSHIAKKINIFVQFSCCIYYNTYTICSLFYFVVQFVVFFTTLVDEWLMSGRLFYTRWWEWRSYFNLGQSSLQGNGRPFCFAKGRPLSVVL